jgi:hypothetical protein
MGLFDVAGRVIAHFEGDASDLKAEIGKVTDAQKKLTREVQSGAEAQTKSLSQQVISFGKVAAGIAAAAGAFKVLQEASKVYAKQAQLEGAAVGANIERIQGAAGGLLTGYQSLQFAAKALNSDFKLSQREMEQTTRFMVVLRNQGHDLEGVYTDVSKALVENNVEGLKKYGIAIGNVNDPLKRHEEILKRIAAENEAAGKSIFRAGDEAATAGVAWEDAIHRLMVALGELATALAPVIKVLADAIGKVVELINRTNAGVDRALGVQGSIKRFQELEKQITDLQRLEAFGFGKSQHADELRRRIERDKDEFTQLRYQAQFRPEIRGPFIGPQEAPAAASPQVAAAAQTLADAVVKQIEFTRRQHGFTPQENRTRDLLESVGGPGLDLSIPDIPNVPPPPQGAVNVRPEMVEGFQQIVEGSELATQSLDALASAGAAAFTALVTGSESFSVAFRKAIGNSLLAVGSQLTVEAIKNGVFALGSLAVGDYAGARGYAIAAAQATAGALAVGVLARALGAGQVAAAATPAAAGAAGIGAGAGGGGRDVTIFVGSDFERNPRGRAASLMAAFERGRRLEGEETVVFD